MKNYKAALLFVILPVVFILIAGSALLRKTQAKQPVNEKEKGFAVVELFTSEGCSSCPPADEAAAALLAKNNPNIFIVSFHVDYWDRLGWKDQFSKHDYSERQQQYARQLSLESVYTPQVIVNGTNQFVGSDVTKLSAAVKTGLQNEQEANFSLTAEKKSNLVSIAYKIAGSETVILNTVIVQPHASTEVKAGENGGHTLNHVNIARELKTTEVKGAGELTMDIPKELLNTSCELIAFTQSKKTLKVLGAQRVNF